MSLLTVADDTSTPGVPVMWAEPTGSAVSMYSDTTAFKMAALRGSSSSSAPGTVTGSSGTRGPGVRGAGRAGRAVRFGTMGVLALDCTECYLGASGQALESPRHEGITGHRRPAPLRDRPAPRRAAAGDDAGPWPP